MVDKTPQHRRAAFCCPHCEVVCQQAWNNADGALGNIHQAIDISQCFGCHNIAIWVNEVMVYPSLSAAPPPNPDMPEEVLEVYEEARIVCGLSPKSAAALLRLAIEKLAISLGARGDLNKQIGWLVEQGMSEKIQKALDVVRVIGNNAVHPGKLNIADDAQTVFRLFQLVNLIVESRIVLPGHVDDMYQSLSEGVRSNIAERDSGR